MKKILVIQQKMIGDVLVSSLLCEHLKSHFPNAEIHYLVNESTTAVVENNPFIDHIVIFKREYQNSKLRFLQFLKSISRERYDTVVDVYGKLESNLITLFSGAKTKVAYPKWYSHLLYTHTVPLQIRQEGATGITVDDRLALLGPLISKPLAALEPKITLTIQEIHEAKEFLASWNISLEKPLIMFGILGSHKNKTYPLNYMAKIIDMVAKITEGTLLFNYIPSQKAQAEKLFQLCGEKACSQIAIGAFAPYLRKFLGLLYHSDALIANEGGTVNMAKALNVPTFSIYSPWIDKMAWDTFLKESNVAVHLNDYHPELIKGKAKKELQRETSELYQNFGPEHFKDKLHRFLDRHVLTNE